MYRPAYLGSDSLYVGFVNFSQSSNFVGVLDNLCIWSRVLSDKEILGLSNQLLDLHISNAITWLDVLGIGLIFDGSGLDSLSRLSEGERKAKAG